MSVVSVRERGFFSFALHQFPCNSDSLLDDGWQLLDRLCSPGAGCRAIGERCFCRLALGGGWALCALQLSWEKKKSASNPLRCWWSALQVNWSRKPRSYTSQQPCFCLLPKKMNVLLLHLQLQTLLLVNDCIYKSACFKTFPFIKCFWLLCSANGSPLLYFIRLDTLVAVGVLLLFIGDGAIALLPGEVHATEPTKVR